MGENPIVWDDDDNLVIKVNCKREAGNFREAIPYCLFVSFEVAEGFDVDLYTEVTAKIIKKRERHSWLKPKVTLPLC